MMALTIVVFADINYVPLYLRIRVMIWVSPSRRGRHEENFENLSKSSRCFDREESDAAESHSKGCCAGAVESGYFFRGHVRCWQPLSRHRCASTAQLQPFCRVLQGSLGGDLGTFLEISIQKAASQSCRSSQDASDELPHVNLRRQQVVPNPVQAQELT